MASAAYGLQARMEVAVLDGSGNVSKMGKEMPSCWCPVLTSSQGEANKARSSCDVACMGCVVQKHNSKTHLPNYLGMGEVT